MSLADSCVQSIRVLDLYPGDHPKRQFTVLYSLGDLQMRMGRLHDAIGTFTKALTFRPASLDARAALTHLLFRTGQLNRGKQELKAVLAVNLCDYKKALDLVDGCIDVLNFSDPNQDDEGRREMLNTMQDAYGSLTNRWKNEEKVRRQRTEQPPARNRRDHKLTVPRCFPCQTVLSLFRAMTKHGFLRMALTHIDDGQYERNTQRGARRVRPSLSLAPSLSPAVVALQCGKCKVCPPRLSMPCARLCGPLQWICLRRASTSRACSGCSDTRRRRQWTTRATASERSERWRWSRFRSEPNCPMETRSSMSSLRALMLCGILSLCSQMGEYATCISNAKEARRRSASEAINLGGSLHLPSLIIVRASIGMNAMDQASTELSQLTSKTAEMGPELLFILSLICSELQQLGTHPELHILSLELLLSVHEREETSKDIAEAAQRLNLTSGLASEQHTFSKLKILGDLIALYTEQYTTMREAMAANKTRPQAAAPAAAAAAAAASSSDDSYMEDDGDGSESALIAVERKLAAAYQKVATELSNPREEEEEHAKNKDGMSSSDSEEEEKEPVLKRETKWSENNGELR